MIKSLIPFPRRLRFEPKICYQDAFFTPSNSPFNASSLNTIRDILNFSHTTGTPCEDTTVPASIEGTVSRQLGCNGLFLACYLEDNCLSTLLDRGCASANVWLQVALGGNQVENPSPQQVVNLFNANGIQLMRIYWPDQPTLQALQGSGIQLLLDVPNEHIQNLAQNPSQATQWVQQNVAPYSSFIRYISVGNEVPQWVRQYVGPAMWNVQSALNKANGLADQIKVTTAIGMSLIKNSYPPSAGEFTDLPFMDPIIYFLKYNGSPLLVNVYPYFSYIYNKQYISLDYALFTSPGNVVTDPNNGLQYQNLFDAMVDSVYAALAKRGAPHTPLSISETGWPSAGGDSASWQHGRRYYQNVIHHSRNGTPLKPGEKDIYLFAMFDEDEKSGAATENNFGLFYPNGQPKYGISFTS